METQIPKQVRDDNVRDTQEGERGVTVFADSENVGLNLFYHLGLESRVRLGARTRCTLMKTVCQSKVLRLRRWKHRSRNKFGMTK